VSSNVQRDVLGVLVRFNPKLDATYVENWQIANAVTDTRLVPTSAATAYTFRF
jgi:hypothetical protein